MTNIILKNTPHLSIVKSWYGAHVRLQYVGSQSPPLLPATMTINYPRETLVCCKYSFLMSTTGHAWKSTSQQCSSSRHLNNDTNKLCILIHKTKSSSYNNVQLDLKNTVPSLEEIHVIELVELHGELHCRLQLAHGGPARLPILETPNQVQVPPKCCTQVWTWSLNLQWRL